MHSIITRTYINIGRTKRKWPEEVS
uniref:Uncharacterized protein n=1 Tax=Anguilla anguilla TaxID=7936 RepID=A0A0E9VMP9_ANGAN